MPSVRTGPTSLLDLQNDPVLVRFIWLASIIFTVIGTAHLATHLQTTPPPPWRIAMSSALIAMGLIASALLLNKKQVAAFELMIWGGWVIVTSVTVVSGGIYSPNLMIYPLLIIAGGWLLSVQTGMVLAFLSIFAIVGLALAQVTDRLPPTQTAPISVAATTAVAMVVAAALCAVFFARSYLRRFNEVRQLGIDLKKSQGQLAYVLSVARESVWSWDVRKDLVVHDRNWCDVLALDEKYLQHGSADFTAPVHEGDRERMLEQLHKCLDGGGPYRSEHRMLRSDGRMIWVRDRADVFERDAQGQPLRVIGSITDITERKRMEEQVHQLAFYDALTRLPNRRLFHDRLTQAMAAGKRTGNHGALMLLDLDNFKPLNDAHGHAAGDMLLLEVAQRLKACVRDTDTVARLGGDEFVVILAELKASVDESLTVATGVAQKIRTTLGAPYRLSLDEAVPEDSAIEHHCSASIGVTLFLGQQASQDELLRRADEAMYRAKESGRNRVQFAESMPG